MKWNKITNVLSVALYIVICVLFFYFTGIKFSVWNIIPALFISLIITGLLCGSVYAIIYTLKCIVDKHVRMEFLKWETITKVWYISFVAGVIASVVCLFFMLGKPFQSIFMNCVGIILGITLIIPLMYAIMSMIVGGCVNLVAEPKKSLLALSKAGGLFVLFYLLVFLLFTGYEKVSEKIHEDCINVKSQSIVYFETGYSSQKTKQTSKIETGHVYICNGSKSTKYHKKENCRGLNNCSTKIEKITKEAAVKKGRSACKICYK